METPRVGEGSSASPTGCCPGYAWGCKGANILGVQQLPGRQSAGIRQAAGVGKAGRIKDGQLRLRCLQVQELAGVQGGAGGTGIWGAGIRVTQGLAKGARFCTTALPLGV